LAQVERRVGEAVDDEVGGGLDHGVLRDLERGLDVLALGDAGPVLFEQRRGGNSRLGGGWQIAHAQVYSTDESPVSYHAAGRVRGARLPEAVQRASDNFNC
jgi:hypothetical protein